MEAACLVRRLGLPQGEEALKARLRRPGHPRLREALAAYLKRLQAPEEVFRALERLEVGAVVTGQQAGLLGGPALTFYKAHTALCLADRAGAAGVSRYRCASSHAASAPSTASLQVSFISSW